MELYILRHAQAVPLSSWPEGDEYRPLDLTGDRQAATLASELSRLQFPIKTILTSPFIRTIQTAKSVMDALPHSKLFHVDELASGVKPPAIRDVLNQSQWAWPLLLVGHMPEIAFFSSRLTGDIKLFEAAIDPAEMLAFNVDSLPFEWGNSKFLWRRRAEDWAGVTA